MNQTNGPIWPTAGLNSEVPSPMTIGQLASLSSPYQNKNLNNMETESVLSGYSERSKKSRTGNGTYASLVNNSVNSTGTLVNSAAVLKSAASLNPYQNDLQANNSAHMINNISGHMNAIRQFQPAKSERLFSNEGAKIDSPYDITNRQEVIEVQTLPEENWGDNTTAITGNTSDHSASLEDLRQGDKEKSNLQMQCHMWAGTVIAIILSTCAFLSPIIMIILPKFEMFEWKTKECGPECDGLMISFVFKLLILLIGSWAVFLRKPKATMPRVSVYRAAVLTLVVIFMVAYWLFYSVRIAEKRFSEEDALSYYSIILFAISLVDALLFIHYLAVILLEIRQLESQYFVKVVRSPDGYSQCYNLGRISIQKASVWILEKYYHEFPIYNPHLERAPTRRGRKLSMSSRFENSAAVKYYDVDGIVGSPTTNGNKSANTTGNLTLNPLQLSPKSILAQNTAANAAIKSRPYMNGGGSICGEGRRRERDTASHHSGHSGHQHRHHNDRFYEEHEYERRVRKRKSRLVSITEEAFTHIKRVQQSRGPSVPMDAKEAAQAIFPSIAKTLQKYLRITRQQSRHTVQSILNHLTTCLSYDLSAKAFLEKYLSQAPVLANEQEKRPVQMWSLICDTLLSRSIESGTVFLLRQGDVSLLVTVHSLPHFNIVEEVIDSQNNKFVFKLNSETSV